MNEDIAREILGEAVKPDNSLEWSTPWIAWYGREICLDGDFTKDDLAAIVWWVANKPCTPK